MGRHCSFPGCHWESLTEAKRGVTLMGKRSPVCASVPRQLAAEARQHVHVHACTVREREEALSAARPDAAFEKESCHEF